MAITLTNEVLAHAIRITSTPTTTLTTEQAVTVIRLAGWMHDHPPGRQHADALGLSGARSMLGPWRVRRAYSLEDTA